MHTQYGGISPHLLETEALTGCCILETSWPMSLRDSPVSTFHLTAKALELQTRTTTTWDFTWVVGVQIELLTCVRQVLCPLIYTPGFSIGDATNPIVGASDQWYSLYRTVYSCHSEALLNSDPSSCNTF